MKNDIRAIVEQVRTLASEVEHASIELRRELHKFPELSWKEHKTAERIVELLKEEGLAVQNGINGTGIVAEIDGGGKGRTIAIRADMDALPMQDAKEVSYASRVPGVMHACGHDCHIAMAIGVAKVLKRIEADFPGRIRFIFQPSEEAFPSGAHELVKAGVMEGVDSIYAFHVDPEIEVGKIGLRPGVLTANASEFNVSIFGKSGHAARPHQAIDTIHIGNHVMTSLYGIMSSRKKLHLPAVLTIGKVDGGTKSNVIADRINIGGTIRTTDDETDKEMKAAIEDRIREIAQSAGASYQLEFPSIIPSVNNDLKLIDLARNVGATLLGREKIVDVKKVSMGAEDFSWFLDEAPGALIRLGVRKPGDEVRYLHSSSFDIDERALPIGVALMSLSVLKYLLGEEPSL